MSNEIVILDVLRLLIATAVLGWASVLDWRTRTVTDALWRFMLAAGAALLVAHILLAGPGWLYLIAVIPPLAFVVPALVGIPEPAEMARGNPEDLLWGGFIAAGAVAFILELLLFDFGRHLRFSIAMVSIPVLILVLYLMYHTRLIHGGADAKAIMALALLFPFYPEYSSLGLGSPLETTFSIRLMQLVFPFAVTALFNAVFIFIFVPLAFFGWNASRGDWGGAKTFFGYRMDVRRLGRPGTFVWLLETAERTMPGKKGRKIPGKSSIMALHNVDPASEVRWFRKAGAERAWVTPKIPFIIPIFAGTLVGALVGNVFFHLFTWMLALLG